MVDRIVLGLGALSLVGLLGWSGLGCLAQAAPPDDNEAFGSSSTNSGSGAAPGSGGGLSGPSPSAPGTEPGTPGGEEPPPGPGAGGTDPGTPPPPGTGGGTQSDDLTGCASDTVHAAEVPLDLLLLVDQSGSMQESTCSGSKWEAQRNAIASFVNHPDSAGVGIGIQFFPLNDSYGYAYCNVSAYSNPEVPIGMLPGQAGAINGAVASHYPEGSTPTLPALSASLMHMAGWAASHPGHVSAVVLATDGEPTECGLLNNVLGVAGVASTYAKQNVLTFVIGVGSSLFSLNSIAAAGGTGQAFIINTNQDVAQQFNAALDAIRGSVACQFQIPVPAVGTPDFNKVNVRYLPAGGTPVVVPHVDDPSQCGGADGWFYDNPMNPTKIILCGATCDAIRTHPEVDVEIVLGCETREGAK